MIVSENKSSSKSLHDSLNSKLTVNEKE